MFTSQQQKDITTYTTQKKKWEAERDRQAEAMDTWIGCQPARYKKAKKAYEQALKRIAQYNKGIEDIIKAA